MPRKVSEIDEWNNKTVTLSSLLEFNDDGTVKHVEQDPAEEFDDEPEPLEPIEQFYATIEFLMKWLKCASTGDTVLFRRVDSDFVCDWYFNTTSYKLTDSMFKWRTLHSDELQVMYKSFIKSCKTWQIVFEPTFDEFCQMAFKCS